MGLHETGSLEQEIELRRNMEAVAVARRRVAPGGAAPAGLRFHGSRAQMAARAEVRLSEMFAPGRDSLVIYSMMIPRVEFVGTTARARQAGTKKGGGAQGPCPSCTAFLDQSGRRRRQRRASTSISRSPERRQLSALLNFAAERRLAGTCAFCLGRKPPITATTRPRPPTQQPMLTCSTVMETHSWGSDASHAYPGKIPATRHSRTALNLYDLTPEGRGIDWDEQLSR